VLRDIKRVTGSILSECEKSLGNVLRLDQVPSARSQPWLQCGC